MPSPRAGWSATCRRWPRPWRRPTKAQRKACSTCPTALPSQKMSHVATRSGVPVGYWRSVGHSHNAFFSESFIDELALDAGQDPLAFRRSLLEEAPRHLAVLDLAAAKAGWGTALPAGRARGMALHESFGSIVAQVVEVSLLEWRAACASRGLRGGLRHGGPSRHRGAADGRLRCIRLERGAVWPDRYRRRRGPAEELPSVRHAGLGPGACCGYLSCFQ
jgi:hypothetical protein